MVTIKDLASYTGVSATTISNVIHGRSSRVSQETIEKVNDAIRTLGYTPNMSARALVSKSSRVVAFINHVITRDNSNMMEDPFHSASIGVIESRLREQGYYLMLRTVKTSDELISFLQNWNVDGLFFTGIFHDLFFDALAGFPTPMVMIDSYVHQKDMYNVGLEDFKGSYLATRHLIEKGHRRIGFATPLLKDGGVLQERFLGYRSALTKSSIPFDPSILFEYEMDSVASCHAAANAITGHLKTETGPADQKITGLVVSADLLAVGILSGLYANHIRVPEDLSIVGFDDLPMAQMAIPPLTTIHQDMKQKACIAADFMLQLLDGEKPDPSNVILPVRLVERESVREL